MSKCLCIAELVMSIFCLVANICPGEEKINKKRAAIGWFVAVMWICIYLRDMF